jgi:hypothetical protein
MKLQQPSFRREVLDELCGETKTQNLTYAAAWAGGSVLVNFDPTLSQEAQNAISSGIKAVSLCILYRALRRLRHEKNAKTEWQDGLRQ